MNVQNIETKNISATEIQDWIVSYLANLLEIESEEIDVTILFDRYGLDSAAAIGLTGALEDWLRMEIEPTVFYNYPTVEALAQHLSQQTLNKDRN